jgi:hypothetical protein
MGCDLGVSEHLTGTIMRTCWYDILRVMRYVCMMFGGFEEWSIRDMHVDIDGTGREIYDRLLA